MVRLPWYIPERWHDRVTVFFDHQGVHFLWTGWNNGQGHAKAKVDGVTVYIHRWIYTIVTGIVLDRFDYVDHRCGYKNCLNYDCHEAVPPGVNTERGPGRLTQYRSADALPG